MRLKVISLLLLGLLSLLAPGLRAQSGGDPSDRFLSAYTLFQKGETLEGSKNYPAAMQAYKEAGQILEAIVQSDPTWNPTIIKYRKTRIDEAITRLQPKVAGLPPPAPAPSGGLVLPTDSLPVADEPASLIPGAPSTSGSRTGGSRAAKAPSTNPLEQLTEQIETLRKAARDAQDDRDKARHERDELDKKLAAEKAARANADNQLRLLTLRSDYAEKALMAAKNKGDADVEAVHVLQDQSAKLKKELKNLKIELAAEAEVRQQVEGRAAAGMNKVNSMQADADKGRKAQADVKKAIDDANKKADATVAEVQKKLDEANKKADAAVADIQKKMDAVIKERDTLVAKLSTVTGERDAARTALTQLKEAQKNVDKLVSDNAALMAKLSDAEKQITQFKADNTQKDILIADLRKEVTSVKKQLDDVKKESASYQTKMSDLQAKLETTAEQLAQAKTASTAKDKDKTKMTAENELLRGIVERQRKAQAGRDQTTKLVLAEMEKMKIKSEDLLSRIKYLGEPVVKLTPKEAALFKKPQVEVGDSEIALVAPKQGGPDSAPELPASEAPAAPLPGTVTPPAPVTPPASAPAPALSLAMATPAPLTPPVRSTPAATPIARAATPAPATPAPSKLAQASPTPSRGARATATPAKSGSVAAAAEQKTELPVSATPAPVKAETKEMASLDISKLTNPARPPVVIEKAPPASSTAKEAHTDPANTGSVTESGAGASTVPAELRPTATEAKDQFDRGNYREAEKLYEKILTQAPTNLYALSNLGVVRFREGKLKLAEESFRKAIAIAPEDAFSRCTLGIIYYSQSRYDEAVNELTKSLAINPKYAAAHNFLGITASQKGWQEAAQKELETATALDSNYADAHFNLAVVYATQQPPDKEKARQFYKKATELGAEADSSLEALLK